MSGIFERSAAGCGLKVFGAVLVIGLLGLARPVRADFAYSPDFASVAGLTLNGSAAQSGTVLRLTPATGGQAGSAWYTAAKQHLSAGFDTTFEFQIGGGGLGGDGFAFVIQNSGTSALGGGGSDLGYGGIASSLAIEFDTFAFFPERANHISVQTRGTDFNSSEDAYSLRQVFPPVDLRDDQVHVVRLQYRPGVLLVYLDSFPSPMIDIALDLQSILGDSVLDGSGDAWVGFTAATGVSTDHHDILSWTFTETGAALPTGGCCLPNGCVETTAHDCLTVQAGYYGGDGTNCGSVACEGACCTTGSCATQILGNCLAGGGTFLGVNLPCVIDSCVGACCDQTGQCFVTDETDCLTNYSGTFHGPGTSCAPFPCSLPPFGACCIMNECLQMSQADCDQQGGTWHGQGTSCFDISCFDPPPPFGACCQPGSTCVESIAEIACTHFNGVYKGDGSLCVNSDCAGVCLWNAATDFSSASNPAGPWSYGSRASLLDTSLSIYPGFLTSLAFGQSGPLAIWYLPGASPFEVPFVLKNELGTSVTIESSPQVIVPAGRVMLHPGPSSPGGGVDSFSVVRWTAPVAGTYQVGVTFYGMDIGATDVHVVRNGNTSVFSGSRSGVGDNRAFSGTFAVSAGDTFDFVVGNDGDASFDSTGLDVCISAGQVGSCDCQHATPIGDNTYFSDSTTGASLCAGVNCNKLVTQSPAKIYTFTATQGGLGLINTCNNVNFNSVISVHTGCPFTQANQIACDYGSCWPGSQVTFCATQGQTYYIRVGGVNGESGNYDLLVLIIGQGILEGPFQNPGNGHWYYITDYGPWTATEPLAVSKGGHMATINDAAENEWVRSTFASVSGQVAIGINDAASEGTFVWTSGQPVGYTNWAPGQPDNGLGTNEDYGVMVSDGSWYDLPDCDAGNGGAVIEVNSVLLPGLLAGPIRNPANCHDYYFTTKGTWLETQLKAQTLGGNLVTINNAAENEFVRSTFANFGGNPQSVWIGLNDTAVENTFVWIDGSPVTYTNWNAGEPNNFGNEDYGMMVDAATGTWNDAHGGIPLSGVIEIAASHCPCQCPPGDMNCDDAVTTADIPFFVQALLQPGPFGGCNINNADMNGDTLMNGRDVRGFVAALLGP